VSVWALLPDLNNWIGLDWIFNIPHVRAQVTVMYFMAQSCLHAVINFLRLRKPGQNTPFCPLICGQYRIPRNSAKT